MSTIKGLTIAIGADTKAFNKGLKAVDRDINNTNKQVNELTKSLELDFDVNRFAEAQRLAQDVIEQTETKARALREQINYMANHGGVDTENYKKLQTELIKTESKAVLLKDKLQEIKNMKMDQAAEQIQKVGDGITKAANAIKPFSIAATAALTSFVAIGKTTIDAAGSLDDMAQEINLNVEALQKWRYIAAQSGLDNQALQNSFIKTQIALSDLATGATGPGSQALASLGLSMEAASKGMDANIDSIIQRLAAIEDPIQKASIANELFGNKLGAKIIPLLNNGAEGIAALTAEFEAFGYMTNDEVASLAGLGDTMERITSTLSALKNEVGVAMIPLMEDTGDFIETKVIPAVKKLTDWFSNLSEGGQKLLFSALSIVAGLAPILLIVGKMTTAFGKLTSSSGGLTKALSFLSAHPVIAVIGLIAALLTILYTKNENYRESINALLSTLSGAVMPVLDTLMESLGAIVDALMPIIDIFGNVLAGVITALLPIITLLVNLLSKLLIPVIEKVANVFAKAFGFIVKVVEGVVEVIEQMINGIIDFINYLIKDLNKLGKVLGFTVDEIKRVELATVKTPEIKTNQSLEQTTEQVIQQTRVAGSPQTVINNDYSDKEIKIEVIVQNYGEEVDVDKLARKINLKLAEEM